MKKWQKIASLILSLLLLLPMCLMASAEEAEPTTPEAPGFHAATVRRLIDANLETASVDEEFYHLLANAYLADPALLTATIADLPNEDITYLAKAIAYDLQKTERENLAIVPTNCATPMQTVIARLICLEADNTANANLESLTPPGGISMSDIIVSPGEELLAVDEVSATLAITETDGRVGDSVTATVYVAVDAPSSTNRRFTVKIMSEGGDTSTSSDDSQLGSRPALIGAGSVSATVQIPIVLNAVGERKFYAIITNTSGTEVARTSLDQLTVTGKWSIDIAFTADRTQLGTIALYNAMGTLLSSNICLGKSAYNYPMNQTDGHTPIGIYDGQLDGYRENTVSFGPHQVISITKKSGYVATHCGHRSGLLIHCGREGYTQEGDPTYPLYHTYGCVRVTNAYQLSLVQDITYLDSNYHDTVGVVTITQDGLTTLPDA